MLAAYTWREARQRERDSATISKHCIMNIPSTSADNESNTSPKVMGKNKTAVTNVLAQFSDQSRNAQEGNGRKTLQGYSLISV